MAMETQETDGHVVLKIDGPMTVYEVAAIRDELLKQLQRGSRVMVILEKVTECDPAAIQLLWAAKKMGDSKGGTFGLQRPSAAVKGAIAQVAIPLDSLGFAE